jgi:hypothetical protein
MVEIQLSARADGPDPEPCCRRQRLTLAIVVTAGVPGASAAPSVRHRSRFLGA